MTKALSERLAAIQEEQENVSTTRTHETEPEAIPVPEKATMQTVIIEETWEQASVYFDAGRGGVITAAGPDRKKQKFGERTKPYPSRTNACIRNFLTEKDVAQGLCHRPQGWQCLGDRKD